MSLFLFTIIFALSVTSLEIHQSFSARQQLPHIRLVRDLLSTERYDPSVRPVANYSESLTVHISMSLYQIFDVDKPSQCLTLNIWMIQKWIDEFLEWDPNEYDMINSTVLPHDVLWIPDTFVYNSMVMNREGSERYMNVIVKSRHWNGEHGAEISFLYPALYTIRCHIDIRYFPYDHQNCTLILGSWTSSKALLNYTADKIVNMNSYIPNEEWDILSFNLHRHEYVYECCQDPWVIIEGSLIIRRKPLYYIVNLIIPTTVLTLVAIVGFFTPASTSDERMEKITIGITALLAVSVLMLMVSDQIPTTSDFVPLIAWFYLSNIIVISAATFCTCTVLRIHGSHRNGKLPPILVRILFFKYICNYLCVSPPHELMMLWKRSRQNFVEKLKQRKKSILNTVQSMDKKKSTLTELSVKPSVQKMLERDNGIETKQTVSRLSAKENWARISVTLEDISSRNKDQSEVVRKESSLTSLIQKIRKTSAERKHLSLWNTAVQFIRFTSNDLPRKIESNELKSLKHRRQCTLEWEFLATVMDRVFLLFFSIITILIVTALAATAKLAQYHFDAALEIAHN
ncbi:Neurotransmitter-gated ion-channel ligand binding domain family protein [Acanthocheilonema viteae]